MGFGERRDAAFNAALRRKWLSAGCERPRSIHHAAFSRVAAERALRKAPILEAPDHAWESFSARFPYQETDDQLNAIQDVPTNLALGAEQKPDLVNSHIIPPTIPSTTNSNASPHPFQPTLGNSAAPPHYKNKNEVPQKE